MIVFYVFLSALVVHFIADFVLQTHWQAVNKSKSVAALSQHVITYTLVFWGFGVVLITLDLLNPPVMLLWIFVNGGLHWGTDYVTSRINARLWQQNRVHAFFVGVGADQLIHSLTLALTLAYAFSIQFNHN